jgi:integrase
VDGGFLLPRKETTVARERTGSIVTRDGKLYARIRFKDESGKTRDIWRKADSRTQARQLIRALLNEVEKSSPATLDAAQMTFDELAGRFIQSCLKPAVYVNGRKVEGVRSVIPARLAVEALRAHFGVKKIRNITHADIRAYKSLRLRTPTKQDIARHKRELVKNPKAEIHVTRTIAAVNREVEKLRRMLRWAVGQEWLLKTPFQIGEPLASRADERARERILNRKEEARLLAAIDAEPKRAHLRGILLVALDCGLRRGEILTLTFGDLDLNRRTITVRAFNAKTARTRTVGMTTRVYLELQRLWSESEQEPDALVFRGIKSIKTAFNKACRAAGVADFHFHDCRATAITRMLRMGLPVTEVMRVSGHSTYAAFTVYARADADTAFRAAAVLDAFHAEAPEAQNTNMPQLIN